MLPWIEDLVFTEYAFMKGSAGYDVVAIQPEWRCLMYA
jgi:hypothetical protein